MKTKKGRKVKIKYKHSGFYGGGFAFLNKTLEPTPITVYGKMLVIEKQDAVMKELLSKGCIPKTIYDAHIRESSLQMIYLAKECLR